MRRNIEFVAESYMADGRQFDAEHFDTEAKARRAAGIFLQDSIIAYVDVAEKWEEPKGNCDRAMSDIPVVYRYIVRVYRDREEAR